MKKILVRSVTLCIILFVLGTVNAQTTNRLSQVSVKGNKFMTANGEVIIFRGLDASDPDKLSKDGHWNKEYFETAKSWGANIIRFPVHPVSWRNHGKDEYIKLLDKGVQWATEVGLYVIIDWHSIGNLHSEMYQNPMYETTTKETFEFWRTMAQHFKDNTTVACFELFNEPTVQGGQLGVCNWQEWKQLNEEMITIIRANGGKAIPLVAGFNWAYDLTPVAKEPIDARNIAYVSHPYPMKRDKPWAAKWTADWGFVAKNYPVILTEIGFAGAEERGAHVPVISDESYGEAITNYCNEAGISYTVWCFDPQWAPTLIKDWNFTLTRQGKYFKDALQKAGK
ncbi:glycoside hydrolase family 5 protein [Segetibacter aerophilus]|uniref:glycoside hydrolase family 5 protein n=1 Tax=Segetibacter aerophilus TaxID=670293 RepID=UPI0011BE74E3|nr:glycoside hydrolase family 5 protein [Segetibacter aerophilus]